LLTMRHARLFITRLGSNNSRLGKCVGNVAGEYPRNNKFPELEDDAVFRFGR
jgi:hypothetical protein